jgi:TIR domain
MDEMGGDMPGANKGSLTPQDVVAEAKRNRQLRLARRSREVVYVEISANPGAGRIGLAFGSVDDGSAFQPEEWIPGAEPLWRPLLGIVGVLCGEDSSGWILSRTRATFGTHRASEDRPFPGHVQLERTVVGMKMPEHWKAIEALIVLDEYLLIDTIDDDLIHLYVHPYAVYSPWDRVDPDNGDKSTRLARNLGPALSNAVTRFMATYLSDDSMVAKFAEPVWEEENAPVYGFSSFEYVGVITNGSVSRPAISTNSPVNVFMCHGSEDKPRVRELTRQLRETDFVTCWFDEDQLLPGQDWELEIAKAVKASDACIVCLSKSSSTRAGYLQKEIRRALDVAQERPEGSIYIIPVRLEPCDVPPRLKDLQWVDVFEPDGASRLLRSLAAIRVTSAVSEGDSSG